LNYSGVRWQIWTPNAEVDDGLALAVKFFYFSQFRREIVFTDTLKARR
jgi:hypothetical protein